MRLGLKARSSVHVSGVGLAVGSCPGFGFRVLIDFKSLLLCLSASELNLNRLNISIFFKAMSLQRGVDGVYSNC